MSPFRRLHGPDQTPLKVVKRKVCGSANGLAWRMLSDFWHCCTDRASGPLSAAGSAPLRCLDRIAEELIRSYDPISAVDVATLGNIPRQPPGQTGKPERLPNPSWTGRSSALEQTSQRQLLRHTALGKGCRRVTPNIHGDDRSITAIAMLRRAVLVQV